MTTVFTSEECDVLEQALEAACEIMQRVGACAPDADMVKAALTRAILDEYEHGERDVGRLASAAVAHTERFLRRPTAARVPKAAL